MKSRTKKIISGIGIAFACLVAPAVYRENFSEEIKNSRDLVRIINEEKRHVKKEGVTRNVYFKYGRTPWGTAASGKISRDSYLIIFDQKRNRTVIRHELYHIYAGHCDRALTKGEWTTLDKISNEVTANIYAWYGLRL